MTNSEIPPVPFQEPKKKSVIREYAESLFWAVLMAFVIRSFIIEPYKIPSKSMVPTLLVGDHIFVNKFSYGLRIPGTKKWIAKFADPKRGEVIVFIYPEDESLDFIKRVVGLPGDHIHVEGSTLFINDHEITNEEIEIGGVSPQDKRELVAKNADPLLKGIGVVPFFRGYESFHIHVEDLEGKKHFMQHNRFISLDEVYDQIVPPDHFFVMGDNRDHSADSRVWGFVPRENLKGHAMFIWLSLDSDLGGIRFKRFGREII